MERLIEKGAPIAVSFLIHVILFIALVGVWVPTKEARPEPRPVIMFVVPTPQPRPEAVAAGGMPMPEAAAEAQETSENPAEQQPELAPAAATVAETQEQKEEQTEQAQATFEVKEEPQEQPEPPTEEPIETPPEETKPEEKPVEKPEPTPRPPSVPIKTEGNSPIPSINQETLEQLEKELAQDKAKQERRVAKAQENLTAIIIQAESTGKGEKADFSSSGARDGTIRKLEMEKYPKPIQEEFKRRYRIRIESKFVDGAGGQSYLNAVSTPNGTYLNAGGPPAYYEVLTLSREVLARMAQLEQEQLKKRGMDPLKSRVREIYFGLRRDESGSVDIFVSRFRAEPIQ